jgi:hypothetical protein
MSSNIVRHVRLTTFAGLALLSLEPLACGTASPRAGEDIGSAAAAIQGGTVDTSDPAIVAILINSSQGLSMCSGTLVAPNLVLTAHHCVADISSNINCGADSFGNLYPKADFAITTNYDAAATIFNGAGVFPAIDGSTWLGAQSVAVPGNNVCGDDLGALTLSAAIGGICPLIPAVDVDVSDGEAYEAIGFGITSPNGQTAGTRYHVGGLSVQCAEDCNDPTQSATLEWVGGASSAKGTCEGDSGGPAVDSIGRAMGSVSRGPSNACNQTVYESYFGQGAWIKSVAAAAATTGGYAAAGWVSGGATSNSANGYCVDAGAAASGDAGDRDGGRDAGGSPSDSGAAHDGAATDGPRPPNDATVPPNDAATPPTDAQTTSQEDGESSHDAGGGGTDAASLHDSGGASHPSSDASARGGHDAGSRTPRSEAGADGGDADGTVGSSGGCNVTRAGTSDASSVSSVLLALGAAIAVRRRRRALA